MPDNRADVWDERYAAGHQLWTLGPHPLVPEVLCERGPGRALDLGAGEGRHALWLAQRGWQVTAVDFSSVGVELGRAHATAAGLDISWQVADLAAWSPAGQLFDLALISYVFLEEDVMERVRSWIVPGGLLMVIGHAATTGADGRTPRNPAFLHTIDSMRRRAGEFTVLRCEESVRVDPEGRERVDVLLLAHP